MNANFKWQKKGKANDANSGVLNLLSLAFKCHATIVILPTKLNEYKPEGLVPSIDTIDENPYTLLRID